MGGGAVPDLDQGAKGGDEGERGIVGEWGLQVRVSPGVGIWRRGVGRRLGRAGGLPDWADQLA